MPRMKPKPAPSSRSPKLIGDALMSIETSRVAEPQTISTAMKSMTNAAPWLMRRTGGAHRQVRRQVLREPLRGEVRDHPAEQRQHLEHEPAHQPDDDRQAENA